MINVNIGKRIKKLRNNHKLSIDSLANSLNISVNELTDIEEGKINLPDYLLDSLVSVFNVSNEYILTGDFKGLKPTKEFDKPKDKELIVKSTLVILTKVDLLILFISSLLFTLIPLFKGDDIKNYLYITLLILNVLLLIYYIIIGRFRVIASKTSIKIPFYKEVKYYNTMDKDLLKKYDKDKLILGLLIILINIIYYSIIFTTLLSSDKVFAGIALVFMILFIGAKVYSLIINIKAIYKTNLYLKVILFLVEIIINTIFIIGLINIGTSDLQSLALFGGFTLLMTLFLMGVVVYYLSKYKYEIE